MFSLSLGFCPDRIPPGRIISPALVAAADFTNVRLFIVFILRVSLRACNSFHTAYFFGSLLNKIRISTNPNLRNLKINSKPI
jgi:hypothetical protein